ncbi:Yip1 family protein [Nanoarchaeota archaeon]
MVDEDELKKETQEELKERLKAAQAERAAAKAKGEEDRPLKGLVEKEEELEEERLKGEKKSWFTKDNLVKGIQATAEGLKKAKEKGDVAKQYIGEKASAVKEKIPTFVSQPGLIMALALAAFNYYFKFRTGAIVYVLHIATWAALALFNYGFPKRLLFIPLAIELIALFIPAGVGGWIAIWPWWATFVLVALFHEIAVHGVTSKVTKVAIVAAAILLIVFGAPYAGYASVSVTLEQKEALADVKDVAVEKLSETADYWKTAAKSKYCSAIGSSSPGCKALQEQEEGGNAEVYISDKLPIQASVGMVEFAPDMSFSQKYDQLISGASKLQNNIEIDLSCEIEDFETGEIKPSSTISLQSGERISESVSCEFANEMTRGTRTLTFNALLKNIKSTSIKDLSFMDKESKDNLVTNYLESRGEIQFNTIADENLFIKTEFPTSFPSTLFVAAGEIVTKSPDEFLVAGIQEGRGVVNSKEKTPYVYGANTQTKIPFKVYLQKNKKGKVMKVNKITVTMPNGLKLDTKDCGYTPTYLEGIDWENQLKSTGTENQYALKSCNIEVTEQLPPTPKLGTIIVTVDYNFRLTEESEVTKSKENT